MQSILPFDELNSFEATLRGRFADGKLAKEDEEDIIDEMLDLFLLAYAMGNSVTNENLSSDWTPPVDDVMKVIDAKVAGKTWRERVEEYFANGGSVDDIVRIAETETHRDANTAAYETAKSAGATTKTWHTMLDDRVRDSHYWLDGVSAPLDGEFYNYKGESTMYPGEWGIAEEDVNCRCWVTYS